jgi:hypothetical protein
MAWLSLLAHDHNLLHMSEVLVGWLMSRLGFTPQRPLYRAW